MSYKNPTGSNDLKSGTLVAYYLLNNINTVQKIVSISHGKKHLVRLVGTKMTFYFSIAFFSFLYPYYRMNQIRPLNNLRVFFSFNLFWFVCWVLYMVFFFAKFNWFLAKSVTRNINQHVTRCLLTLYLCTLRCLKQ